LKSEGDLGSRNCHGDTPKSEAVLE
jgi:hypothetical protein